MSGSLAEHSPKKPLLHSTVGCVAREVTVKVESVLDWTQAAEAGFKEMEGHFTEGEGARAVQEVEHIWWCSPPCRA